MGKKGKSNRRWIVGGKLCLVLNHLGVVMAWDYATANIHGPIFSSLPRSLKMRWWPWSILLFSPRWELMVPVHLLTKISNGEVNIPLLIRFQTIPLYR
jgi:hypothetical protein